MEKTKILTDHPVIDITQPDWKDKIDEQVGPDGLDGSHFLCIGQAYIVARKRLPSHTVVRIDSPESISDETNDGQKIAAVRIGDIAISKKFHPVVDNSKAWMSPYHLGLIKELFGERFVVEILDEMNNPITVLGDPE